MTLQWTAIAGFLYLEIFIAFVLMIPFISASRWNKIFRSRLISKLAAYSNVYFSVILVTLAFLFVDAIREVYKYTKLEDYDLKNTRADSHSVIMMRLFRGQRNLYVSGFSVFMALVLRKMINNISTIAQLEASTDAALKQAMSASEAAKLAMSDDSKSDSAEVIHLNNKLSETKEAMEMMAKDMDAMKSQTKRNTEAYDELLLEYEKVKKELVKHQGGGDESKKDN